MNKKSKLFAFFSCCGMLGMAFFLISGDHNDSPSLSGTTSDIADFYAFESPQNTDNLVLVMNMQGMLPAGTPTTQANFDEDVLMEFNIDVNNDLKKDVLIQAIRKGDSLYFFGPFSTTQEGLESQINIDAEFRNQVKLSTLEDVFITENDGMKFFAGPREDPFFFDRDRYDAYMAGSASAGFNNPGTDTYAGTNVLSVVIEVPKTLLRTPTTQVNPFAPDVPTWNMWIETKRKTK